MREVRGIDGARPFQMFVAKIQIAKLEVIHAELRVRQCVVGTQSHRHGVVLPSLIGAMHGDQYATEVDQGLEGLWVLFERFAETLLGAGVRLGLVAIVPRLIPGRGELRRQRDRLRQAPGGGIGIVTGQVLVRLFVVALRLGRDCKLGRGDRMPAAQGV
jgi:hypothetical protein